MMERRENCEMSSGVRLLESLENTQSDLQKLQLLICPITERFVSQGQRQCTLPFLTGRNIVVKNNNVV